MGVSATINSTFLQDLYDDPTPAEVLAVSTSGGQISSNEELMCIVFLSLAEAPYMELGCQKAWSVLLTIA